MTWIQTFTGVAFHPLAPIVGDVRIEDIAHALSMKCRFSGMCNVFYSVAEHSICVMNRVRELGGIGDTVRAALLHDAAEAYLPDVSRPIKHLVQMGATGEGDDVWTESFADVERRLRSCIFDALGVDVSEDESIIWKVIKEADNELLATERRDLMGPSPAKWEPLPPPLERVRLNKRSGHCWQPAEAEQFFLQVWKANEAVL